MEIKYIRGSKDNPEGVRNALVKMGMTDCYESDDCFEDYCSLFCVNKIGYLERIYPQSALHDLILQHGTEVFIEPDYKFAVGDCVRQKHTNVKFYIHKRYTYNGKPRYYIGVSKDKEECNILGEVAEEELSPYYYGYEELFEFLNLNEISNDDIRQIMMDKAIQSVAWAENHTIWHDCKKELPTDIDNKYIYIEYYSHNRAGHPFNKHICVIGYYDNIRDEWVSDEFENLYEYKYIESFEVKEWANLPKHNKKSKK